MRIVGILLVRDAVDLVRVNVLHHLSLGCAQIVALDNGSTDGTAEVLDRLASRVPLAWRSDTGPFEQARLMTDLARSAVAAGAEWILPIDVDEFWTASRPLRDVLADAQAIGAGAVMAERTNFIQRRAQRRSTPRGLLSMDRRVAETVAGQESARRALEGALSVFECRPGSKILPRAAPELTLARGGHDAGGLAGPLLPAPELHVLHAAIRSREAMAARREHGARVEEVGTPELEVWHARRWARELRDGRLEAEWRAHSYEGDTLEVDDRAVRLARDDRLRRAVVPYVRAPVAQAVARVLGRTY